MTQSDFYDALIQRIDKFIKTLGPLNSPAVVDPEEGMTEENIFFAEQEKELRAAKLEIERKKLEIEELRVQLDLISVTKGLAEQGAEAGLP